MKKLIGALLLTLFIGTSVFAGNSDLSQEDNMAKYCKELLDEYRRMDSGELTDELDEINFKIDEINKAVSEIPKNRSILMDYSAAGIIGSIIGFGAGVFEKNKKVMLISGLVGVISAKVLHGEHKKQNKKLSEKEKLDVALKALKIQKAMIKVVLEK